MFDFVSGRITVVQFKKSEIDSLKNGMELFSSYSWASMPAESPTDSLEEAMDNAWKVRMMFIDDLK